MRSSTIEADRLLRCRCCIDAVANLSLQILMISGPGLVRPTAQHSLSSTDVGASKTVVASISAVQPTASVGMVPPAKRRKKSASGSAAGMDSASADAANNTSTSGTSALGAQLFSTAGSDDWKQSALDDFLTIQQAHYNAPTSPQLVEGSDVRDRVGQATGSSAPGNSWDTWTTADDCVLNAENEQHAQASAPPTNGAKAVRRRKNGTTTREPAPVAVQVTQASKVAPTFGSEYAAAGDAGVGQSALVTDAELAASTKEAVSAGKAARGRKKRASVEQSSAVTVDPSALVTAEAGAPGSKESGVTVAHAGTIAPSKGATETAPLPQHLPATRKREGERYEYWETDLIREASLELCAGRRTFDLLCVELSDRLQRSVNAVAERLRSVSGTQQGSSKWKGGKKKKSITVASSEGPDLPQTAAKDHSAGSTVLPGGTALKQYAASATGSVLHSGAQEQHSGADAVRKDPMQSSLYGTNGAPESTDRKHSSESTLTAGTSQPHNTDARAQSGAKSRRKSVPAENSRCRVPYSQMDWDAFEEAYIEMQRAGKSEFDVAPEFARRLGRTQTAVVERIRSLYLREGAPYYGWDITQPKPVPVKGSDGEDSVDPGTESAPQEVAESADGSAAVVAPRSFAPYTQRDWDALEEAYIEMQRTGKTDLDVAPDLATCLGRTQTGVLERLRSLYLREGAPYYGWDVTQPKPVRVDTSNSDEPNEETPVHEIRHSGRAAAAEARQKVAADSIAGVHTGPEARNCLYYEPYEIQMMQEGIDEAERNGQSLSSVCRELAPKLQRRPRSVLEKMRLLARKRSLATTDDAPVSVCVVAGGSSDATGTAGPQRELRPLSMELLDLVSHVMSPAQERNQEQQAVDMVDGCIWSAYNTPGYIRHGKFRPEVVATLEKGLRIPGDQIEVRLEALKARHLRAVVGSNERTRAADDMAASASTASTAVSRDASAGGATPAKKRRVGDSTEGTASASQLPNLSASLQVPRAAKGAANAETAMSTASHVPSTVHAAEGAAQAIAPAATSASSASRSRAPRPQLPIAPVTATGSVPAPVTLSKRQVVQAALEEGNKLFESANQAAGAASSSRDGADYWPSTSTGASLSKQGTSGIPAVSAKTYTARDTGVSSGRGSAVAPGVKPGASGDTPASSNKRKSRGQPDYVPLVSRRLRRPAAPVSAKPRPVSAKPR
jgi:hypothetical protein